MSTLDNNNYKMFYLRHDTVIARCNHCKNTIHDNGRLLTHENTCKLKGPRTVQYDNYYEMLIIERVSPIEETTEYAKLIDEYKNKCYQLDEMCKKYNDLEENHENLYKRFIKYEYYVSLVFMLLFIYITFLNLRIFKDC